MDSKAKFEILKAGKQRKRKKAKVRYYGISRKIEVYYAKELLAISNQCKLEGQAALKILADNRVFLGDSGYVINANIGDAPAFLSRIKNFVLGGITSRIDRIANTVAPNVVKGQIKETDKKLVTKLKDATGVDVSDLILSGEATYLTEIAVARNVSLIRSIPDQYHIKLENLILESLSKEKSEEWLTAEIKKLGDVTDARARFIARDQIASINAETNKQRNKELGIEEYIWTSQGDNRVRAKHRELNKRKFSWDEPSDEGHPGEPPGCRCDAVPYI